MQVALRVLDATNPGPCMGDISEVRSWFAADGGLEAHQLALLAIYAEKSRPKSRGKSGLAKPK